MTDTERLDALEKLGNGIALIHDDNESWAIATDGFQNIRHEACGTEDADLETSYFVPSRAFRKTIREAIDTFLAAEEEDEE